MTLEVYQVSGPRTHRHVEHWTNPKDWVCSVCQKPIDDEDVYRLIATRMKGTKWTDREYWRVHNKCFMGRNLKPR